MIISKILRSRLLVYSLCPKHKTQDLRIFFELVLECWNLLCVWKNDWQDVFEEIHSFSLHMGPYEGPWKFQIETIYYWLMWLINESFFYCYFEEIISFLCLKSIEWQSKIWNKNGYNFYIIDIQVIIFAFIPKQNGQAL